jgi:hypothetical protein
MVYVKLKLMIMKTLEKIITKYSKQEFNEENYSVGGGLTDGKFASNRHENAKSDKGKLTFGKTCQMFKEATGCDLDFVKKIIKYAVPNMEWHHAGKLPKQYGGGMKKTYFLNSQEIVSIANDWSSLVEKIEISKQEKRVTLENIKVKENSKLEYLKAYAKRVVRISEKPEYFYETDKEMNGKYGWFSSYGKSYNLPEYYTGWVFESSEKYAQFNELQ